MGTCRLIVFAGLVACVVEDKEPVDDKAGDQDDVQDVDTGVDDTGPEVDTGLDTAADTGDTGDTGPVEPAWGDCAALLEPIVVDDGNDIMEAHRWLLPDIGGIEAILLEARANAEEGCPTLSPGSDDSDFVLEGDCTTSEGVQYKGRVSVASDGSATGWERYTQFDAFEIWLGEEVDDVHFWADGVLELSGTNADVTTGTAETFVVTADLLHGFENDPLTDSGEWAHRMTLEYVGEDGLNTTDAYVWAIQTSEMEPTLGDWCETVAIADATGCADEVDGTITVSGLTSATMTLDGSIACDGCGTVTAGAMSAYCPDWGGGDTGDTGGGGGGGGGGGDTAEDADTGR